MLIVWRHYAALGTATWYMVPAGEQLQRSRAGLWYGYASLPIFQLMLLRWYFRLFIWARFLWQVSRLELSLVLTHPDRTGDIQSLADLANSFEVIRTMRLVPFTNETPLQLLVTTLAPALPLTLTMVPLEELLRRLLGAVF